MNPMRILGIVALVIGAALLAIGYNASQAPVDQVSNVLTGRYTDHTMWYILGGGGLLVAGLLVALVGRRA
jgi:hypothetical protein